jgi:hypothetical protein
MATNFPASLDTLTNPTSSDSLSSPSHSAQHANVNDAVEALQAKVGADSSAVTSSLDYKVADHASRLTTLEGTASPGLVLLSTTTVGTAVSSVTVSGAFSSAYDVYHVVYTQGVGSTQTTIDFRLGAVTTGYKYSLIYAIGWTGSPSVAANTNYNKIRYMGLANTGYAWADFVVRNPYLTQPTTTFMGGYSGNGADASPGCTGYLDDTNSYTDFTLLTHNGTLTGGDINIYGVVKG